MWSEVRTEARGRAPSYSSEPWFPQRKPGAPLGHQHPMGSTCNHRGIAQAGPFPGPGVGYQPGGRPYTSCVRLEIILCREVGSLVAGIRSGPARDRDKSDTDGKGLCLTPNGAASSGSDYSVDPAGNVSAFLGPGHGAWPSANCLLMHLFTHSSPEPDRQLLGKACVYTPAWASRGTERAIGRATQTVPTHSDSE